MRPKRNVPKRQPPQLDDRDLLAGVNLPLTPALLAIANILPPDVDAPEWGTREPRWSAESQYPLVAKAKAALARVGIDPERTEAARFEQFLDERFPREKFADFRRMVDGPNLEQMANRKPGVQIFPRSGAFAFDPKTKLANYHFVIETRAYWRAAAKILARVVAGSRPRPPLLRICKGCKVLFIARRANKVVHTKKCGSRVRMARMRADGDKHQNYEYHDYEYQRKKKGRRQSGKRKDKKEIAKRNPAT